MICASERHKVQNVVVVMILSHGVLSCSKTPSRNRLSLISCISFKNLFFQRFQSKTGNGIFLKWNGFITGHIRLQLITDKDIVILLLLINSKPFLALGLTVGRGCV